ncbi:MAG: hypothetical protein ABFS43_11905 [Thermodesulfobacteriota bacterium]
MAIPIKRCSIGGLVRYGMKNKAIILAIICFTLIYQAPFSFGDTVHFDSKGTVIDKIHYEIIVSEREKVLRLKLKNGYGSESTWRDPIKLRQKRIYQWRILRSLYDPDSLPEIIENLPTKNMKSSTP